MNLLQTLSLILVCFFFQFCTCRDTITSTQSIIDTETLVSSNTIFKLGFFSPANTTHRYVGIQYNVPSLTPVWVANRDKSLNDTSGSVAISEHGNLVVLDGDQNIIWSTNISNSNTNSSAQLLDTGNLVLRNISNGRIIWESFENPTDSYLQKMKMHANVNRDEHTLMTSWKSPSDPSIGSFTAGLDLLNIPQFFIWNEGKPHWRSGPWNGQIFIGIPNMSSLYTNGFNLADDNEGGAALTFTYANESIPTYFLLNSRGNLMKTQWLDENEDWVATWSAVVSECDVYGKCGPFGSCNSQNSPICECFKGFEPNNIEEWSGGNWTSGCVRRTLLQCDRNSSIDKVDGFLKLTSMIAPDFFEWTNARSDHCMNQCLDNCSCIAYAYYTGIGCMHWNGSLIDIKKFPGSNSMDLYIRVAYSELDKKRSLKVLITITVILGSIAIAVCAYFSWKWMVKRKGRARKNELLLSTISDSYESSPRDTMNKGRLEELPLITFQTLAVATENFQLANKLGQGGFGPVYKGKMPNGKEIAVKRLSRSSGQGLEEFMNEVVVISKLQHRNLVKLIGCCVEGAEKMLVYEYMPKRSLDAFLFVSDPLKQEQLDWSTRINIIEGIGRGLLYLHRDSRLRIIHRDLKASNILLDEELNPKISDFGMARIFGGHQDQANTIRVVGTYGYMAPEYAMEGRFSEKSDVFSFGVLLLEIVSGRKNTSFYDEEHGLSLLGVVWKLWNEEKTLEFTDRMISDPCLEIEILRYIHVGLLCVQEFAKDRPTVSIVLSMLNSEIADLPTPRQPAFTERKTSSKTNFPQQKYSINNVTVTVIEGR